MWYFFHLMSPFLIILVFDVLKRHERLYVLFLPFLILNLYTMTYDHDLYGNLKRRMNSDLKNWRVIEQQISDHKNILNSPIVAPLLVHQNKRVYDSGLTEYFKMGAYRYSLQWLFPKGRKVMVRHYEYLKELKELIRKKQFDLVLISRGNSPIIPAELVDYYNYMGSVRLPLPHCLVHFDVTVWKPK